VLQVAEYREQHMIRSHSQEPLNAAFPRALQCSVPDTRNQPKNQAHNNSRIFLTATASSGKYGPIRVLRRRSGRPPALLFQIGAIFVEVVEFQIELPMYGPFRGHLLCLPNPIIFYPLRKQNKLPMSVDIRCSESS